ncbi:MAG TPA: HXXEE domain-containing protein [Vicinamibacterales bacterium]|nr:HXXEE domain-containing protein [Vicinamibacterales bacterium]
MTDAVPPAMRHARAWLLLVAALALHVADEALTHFLEFYNPLVLRIRSRIAWFPMPTFEFDAWLAGLILVVIILGLLTPLVRRGAVGTRLASWILAVIMFFNGLGHLVGSAYFQRWLPGATSAPLLLVASVMLARATRARA